jgi:hypothetical protein
VANISPALRNLSSTQSAKLFVKSIRFLGELEVRLPLEFGRFVIDARIIDPVHGTALERSEQIAECLASGEFRPDLDKAQGRPESGERANGRCGI